MHNPPPRRHGRSPWRYLMLCMAGLFITLTASAQNTGLLDKLTGKAAEPVAPGQAFSVKARRIDASRIALDYAVRPGYYL